MTELMDALKREMWKHPQASLKTDHYFADGMYLRTLFRPAGTTIVGKVHKKDHLYMVAFGTVVVVHGGERETVTGPHVFVCKAGAQRAVYAVTDALCLTVHRTEEKELDRVEDDLVEADPESPYLPGNTLKPDLLESAPCRSLPQQ